MNLRIRLAVSLFFAAIMLLPLAGFVHADQIVLSVADETGSVDSTTDVAIEVRDPQGLGAVQFDLIYDPDIVEPEAVEAGEDVSALVDYNIVVPGTLRVAAASNEPIEEDGTLAVVTFMVLAEGETDLDIELAEAWEQETSYVMPIAVEGGSISATSDGLGWLLAMCGCPTLFVVVVVLLVVRWWRRRKERQKSPPAGPPE
jgi:hypothetical protein